MPLTQVGRGGLSSDAIDASKLADDSIDSEHIVDGSVDHAHLSADCVDGDNIADNSINSEHYVDGSIDHVHLAGDCVDGDNIADNSINSEHYVDGSIDHAHLSDDCVDGDNIAHDADLPNGVLAATQTAGDNTRKLATTAFVTTAVGAISQDAIVTPQAAQNNRTFSTGNNHLLAGPVTIADGAEWTLTTTARLIIA